MKKISIIIPCYNEQEAVPLFYTESMRVLKELNYEYELIFVNDGSKDQTLAAIKGLCAADPHVVYLSFSRNIGK